MLVVILSILSSYLFSHCWSILYLHFFLFIRNSETHGGTAQRALQHPLSLSSGLHSYVVLCTDHVVSVGAHRVPSTGISQHHPHHAVRSEGPVHCLQWASFRKEPFALEKGVVRFVDLSTEVALRACRQASLNLHLASCVLQEISRTIHSLILFSFNGLSCEFVNCILLAGSSC